MARWLSLPWLVILSMALASCVSGGDGRIAPDGAASATASPMALASMELASDSSGSSCPVTPPPSPPFVPPAAVTLFAGSFWHGTAALWTEPRIDGVWRVSSDKVFWWSEGYDWRRELQPDLVVTGRRLDGPAPPLIASAATHAINAADIGTAMLVGVTLPTPGCWEISGRYKASALTFVVWFAP